jgi:hypothetical protein
MTDTKLPVKFKPARRIFQPLCTVGTTEHRQGFPSKDRAECPECYKIFVAGVLVIEPQEPITDLADYSGPCELVHLYCDHCNHIIQRYRAVNSDGTPGPWIGDGYGLITAKTTNGRRRIAAFLTAHPEAAGVEQ